MNENTNINEVPAAGNAGTEKQVKKSTARNTFAVLALTLLIGLPISYTTGAAVAIATNFETFKIAVGFAPSRFQVPTQLAK